MKTHVRDQLAGIPDLQVFHDQHVFAVQLEIRKGEGAVVFDGRLCHHLDAVKHFLAGICHARRGCARLVAVDIILQFFDLRLLAVVFVLVLFVKDLPLNEISVVIAAEFTDRSVIDTDDDPRHLI